MELPVEKVAMVGDRLFTDVAPDAGDKNFLNHINPDSLEILSGCKAEKGLQQATSEDRYQFEREGYFCADNQDSSAEHLVFNRTVALRDSWPG